MDEYSLKTDFLPAERSSEEDLNNDIDLINKFIDKDIITDAIPNIFLILNSNRQIVYCNKALRNQLNINDNNTIFGLRPGELLNCVYSTLNEGGCGTSEFCRNCGAANAIKKGLEGKNDVQECRIISSDGEAYDLKVYATPFNIENQKFTIFIIEDISNQKRKEIFERIFFHDILNTTGSLRGWVELLETDDLDQIKEAKTVLSNISQDIIEQIMYQRMIVKAENNDLELNIEQFAVNDVIKKLVNEYRMHNVAKGKNIIYVENTENPIIKSDFVILCRIIGNLLKNALEASKNNQSVTLQVEKKDNCVVFSVHNEAYLSKNVQAEIFKRSFSTKGVGRGLGTYSVKLLTERYLGGKVYYKTDKEEGTVFFIELPMKTQ